MRRNVHIWTAVLGLSDLEGRTPKPYQRADGEIFAPGKYGARQKGWGEAGHGGVVVSLLVDDDGEWFRDLARRKDAGALVRLVQFP